jgi:hypothetical protein
MGIPASIVESRRIKTYKNEKESEEYPHVLVTAWIPARSTI